MLAEPADAALLVEVRLGGRAALWSGPPGAVGLPPDALGPRCSFCVAPQHDTSALPFLQVCPLKCFVLFLSFLLYITLICLFVHCLVCLTYFGNGKKRECLRPFLERKQPKMIINGDKSSASSFLIDDSLYLLNTEKMGVKVE